MITLILIIINENYGSKFGTVIYFYLNIDIISKIFNNSNIGYCKRINIIKHADGTVLIALLKVLINRPDYIN